MTAGAVNRKMLSMTNPTVTEIKVRLTPVEHDDFVDRLPVTVPVPIDRRDT